MPPSLWISLCLFVFTQGSWGLAAQSRVPASRVPTPRAKAPKLYAAAGKADISPDLRTETIWLAGYGASGRRAKGVHDPIYARALVLSDGTRTVAFVAVDSIGIFRQDVLDIRRGLGWDRETRQHGVLGPSRYLFLASTHDHSAPDTLGLWGRFPGVSGVDPEFHRRLKASIVGLVRDLAGKTEEAELTAASVEVNPVGLCRDSRDPVVVDPELQAMQLRRKGGRGDVIGTAVRWSCHSEVMGSDNLYVTADYPGELCARVEQKTGGACVFFNGVIGGLLTPDTDRSAGVEQEFAESRRIGGKLGDLAMEALRRSADRIDDAVVTVDSRVVRVPVENSRYLLFLPSLTFGHQLLEANGSPMAGWREWWLPLRHLLLFPLPDHLRPWVETEVTRIRIGPVDILGIPGELFPELAIGGYDGKYRFGHPLIQPKNVNPPDLSKAPKGPYLREKLGSKHGWLVGLANDELGYIIPEYDFQFQHNRSMSPRLPGHHYEETNSTGKSVTRILLNAYDEMLKR